MIIWINGAFGAGKTTLAEELSRRLPEAVLFDPEYVGYLLRHWVPVPTGDFQDLPSWRELVIATALSLRRHHAGTLIAPMTLINDDYLAEILGGLRAGGAESCTSFSTWTRRCCGSGSPTACSSPMTPPATSRRVTSAWATPAAASRRPRACPRGRCCSAPTS